MSQNSEPVEKEMKKLTASYQADKLEFIKNPVIAEFLGLSSNIDFTEGELEQRIITHIQKFLMELGKGYAFVARQQHIRTEKEDYYIDLVFYNYILKCFVLIDLKTSKITHQDVGQMDMYIRMYDEMKRNEGDNPTLGIILCSDTDEDIAKYSILHGHEQLFASKYKTCLPSEEQLREEIEIQKKFYYLQKEEDKKIKIFRIRVKTGVSYKKYDLRLFLFAESKTPDYFDGDTYIQHNTSIADGVSGLNAALTEMAEQGITMVYDEVHMVLAQGNYVLAVSEGTFAGEPTSYYDLWRVENGKIAEHWDVMETIAEKSHVENEMSKMNLSETVPAVV